MNKILVSIAALALAACTKDANSAQDESGAPLGRSVAANSQAAAQHGKNSQRPSAGELTTSFDYFDGSDQRTVWLSTELVAEFDPSNAGRETLLRSDPAGEEVPQAQKRVRLWRVRATQGADAFARDMNANSPLHFSPVLHDGPSTTLPIRALPGGVVATFAPDWSRARVDAWVAAHHLTIASEVIEGGNVFELATAPGLEALQIANQLYATGDLVACTPNFWQQFSPR
jgi:hypothetical protein